MWYLQYMNTDLGNCIQTSTKNRFKTEYFTRKRDRELHNGQFLGESNGFPLQKLAFIGLSCSLVMSKTW